MTVDNYCERCTYYGEGDWSKCSSCRDKDKMARLEAENARLRAMLEKSAE